MKYLISAILLFITTAVAGADKLKTYPAPLGADLSHDFEVKVRVPGGKWQKVDTYAFAVARVESPSVRSVDTTSVAKFDFEGKVEVAVTSLTKDIKSIKIRPLSYNIKGDVTDGGNTVTFSLDRPRYISIEVNGDIFHNLQIFADNIAEKPRVKKRDLIYFGPGLHVLPADSMAIPSGKTVYIDGGAVVRGWLSVYRAQNVRILGHGIVLPKKRHEGIMVRYSKNVIVDGPLTTQLPIGGSDSVDISNVKVISSYNWGDGLNVFASNNVTYRNVFARTSDDCSTIYCTRKGYNGGCRNITVDGAVYWADVAHPIMIGLHGNIEKNETIENVLYKDIDILDQAEQQIDYMGCIGINNGDNILIKDITFDNIRIESLRKGMLFNMRVCYNKKYCHAPGRGIEDITLRNISYTGKQPMMSIITGYSPERGIKGLHFENLTINGVKITDDMPTKPKWYKTSDMADIFVGEHVSDVTFK